MRHILTLAILIAPIFAADSFRSGDNLTAHEWGTFTSVAGATGDPVGWTSLENPGDLPCFVAHIGAPQFKFIQMARVRMETPVLYFYSQLPRTISVHVDFPQGWMTEWFPIASHTDPDRSMNLPLFKRGSIDWDNVELLPGDHSPLPTGEGASRYYAARNTDATPLKINGQHEKMIFYRGVADFSAPLRAKFLSDGKLELRNAGDQPIPLVILFENRRGKLGYRIAQSLTDQTTLDPPELNSTLNSLRTELAAKLAEFGLYPKEAAAMLETWRDSWFEEGTRVLYIMPRQTVDSVLPLTVKPQPSAIARVFVGRVEVLSPATRETIETALNAHDTTTLARYGRFLQPFLAQMHRTSIAMPVTNPATCVR